MMAYKTAYHEDSDADDEYERSVITSPTLPPDFESSPTDSDAPSTEHTPTTYTHSVGGSHASPTGLITQWTTEQCADWVSGLGFPKYADTFLDEAITGEALIAVHHAELKEMGISSVGHRLTILKSIYDMKVKQNIAIEPDHYVPLSAEAGPQDTPPTQDDVSRIIRIIKDRDERIMTAETELRILKDDLQRILDENRKLREEFLNVARMVKDRSQPLPTPDGQADGHNMPPSGTERSGSSLSRKFSTKKLFLGNAPKNPSPTIYEGRPLTDTSHLESSAAALAASNNLTASLGSAHATSPHSVAQPSPTSPAYSQHTAANSIRNFPRNESRSHNDDSYSTYNDRDGGRGTTTNPLNARPLRSNQSVSTPDATDRPLSAGLNSASSTNLAPTPTTNPQVEIFKSFRVSIDDPCHKVLPVALKKYNITADWRQYALYIVHGDQERCLGLNERPLILFKQLDKEGRKPMFMLRKHAAPAEGHVSTVGGGGPQSVGHDGGQQRWTGGSVQLPGGVL